MWLISFVFRIWLIISNLQERDAWSIRELTFINSRPCGTVEETKVLPFDWSHGWPQTLIFSPFSILLHPWPSLITAPEAKMLRHIWFGLCPRLTSKKSVLEKYWLWTLLKPTFGWVMNFQACFPSIDKLKAWRWQNPIPPLSFFIVNCSQLIKFIPLTHVAFFLHQKEFIIFCRSFSRKAGRRKTLMK